MGLIKAAAGAVGGMMADQWKEFFVCDAIDDDVLVVKGSKQASGRSSNTKGESNVISDGSAVSVADGQCMMIVEQGRVIELSAEPGIFIYKNDLFAVHIRRKPEGWPQGSCKGCLGSF